MRRKKLNVLSHNNSSDQRGRDAVPLTDSSSQPQIVTISNQNRIGLPDKNGARIYYDFTDIIRCESSNVFTTFFILQPSGVIEEIPITQGIGSIENFLPDYYFFRAHNSHIINLGFVAKSYLKGNSPHVVMYQGNIIPVSKDRKSDLALRLSHYPSTHFPFSKQMQQNSK